MNSYKALLISVLLLFTHQIFAEKPIILIGASFINGKTRVDDTGHSLYNGFAVSSGSYFSLGNALIRENLLNGLVINEANVGSTTFSRYSCSHHECSENGIILGYERQLTIALMRVFVPNKDIYNADYLIIGLPNDCIHSDSFGIPQIKTKQCTVIDMQRSISSIINISKKARQLGLDVIIPIPPLYNDLDLSIVKYNLNMLWVINEYNYNKYRSLYIKEINDNVPGDVLLNIWKDFNHIGDGIHPDRKTVLQASKHIANYIKGKNGTL